MRKGSSISTALALLFIVGISTGDGVRAQAPPGAGPSVAPRSKRVHPLVPADQTSSPAQPHGPSGNAPVTLSGSWQALTNTPPGAVDNCLLLTDGAVMCHGYGSRN